ncbi:hypothetical protein CF336_g2287 [Tilletia laevis]|nr:hypothetical protein CF336_g2287 [Tilletia laevis]
MSIHSRSQSSNSTTLAASTRASPSSAVPQRAISLNLPKKLIKEKSALSKCKAFVKGAQAASPPTVESNDVDENDIDESDTLLSDDDDSMEEDSEEDEDENDPNIDPRLLGHTKATLVSNRKSKSSGSSSINAPLGKLPTKYQSSSKRAKWQLEAEIAQLRADVAQISAAMTQIADHISVRPACTCNDPSTTSSSSDSLYASVMAPSQLIVANSAAEYSSKAKINVSPDVMFTIDEARQYIAQKAGKTIDALHPSTLIPQELCTRTADGKDASTVRQNQIRKMLREVCVVIETLPDKREEEDGMIKTRGIQYFRDNYRTIFDRLVDKLEVAIPELQLCAGSQQDYDYRQGQGQGSRPYGYQQGHERGQSQGYENPSYGTNSYSINPYGANPYNNPYRLSPPPTHHSTQA